MPLPDQIRRSSFTGRDVSAKNPQARGHCGPAGGSHLRHSNYDATKIRPVKIRPTDKTDIGSTSTDIDANRQQVCGVIVNSLPSSKIPCPRRKISLPGYNDFPARAAQGIPCKPLKRKHQPAPESPVGDAIRKISLPNSLPAGTLRVSPPGGPHMNAASAPTSFIYRPSRCSSPLQIG